jgi:Fe-Mn family superoxide dismutase
MKLHHSKHHQAYVNGLNTAEEAYAKADDIKTKISLQSALKFNGGGQPPFPLNPLPHHVLVL